MFDSLLEVPAVTALFFILLTAIVLFILLRVVGPRWAVRIIAGPDAVRILRGIPKSRQAELTTFLRNDLSLAKPITILASKDRSGRLKTRIKGAIDDGQRQRIRNYLLQIL